MRFEVDMQPLCSALSGHICGLYNHASSDTLSSHPRVDTGVEDKGVGTSVPCHVYEADEPTICISPYMREAARQDAREVFWLTAAPSF